MSVGDFLTRAATYLESAELLLGHGDAESSVSRSYYAMFFAAEAALMTKQLAFSSHKGVIAGFGEHFVRPGVFPSTMGRDLARAQDKRLIGDYDATPRIARDDAAETLRQAREFVERVAAYVRKAASSDDS